MSAKVEFKPNKGGIDEFERRATRQTTYLEQSAIVEATSRRRGAAPPPASLLCLALSAVGARFSAASRFVMSRWGSGTASARAHVAPLQHLINNTGNVSRFPKADESLWKLKAARRLKAY